LKEFDFEIKDKKGSENIVADHLSRLVNNEETKKEKEIIEEFLNKKLLLVHERPWFAYMANYKAVGVIPDDLNWHKRRIFLRDLTIMFGMILIFSKLVLTTCCAGVCQLEKPRIFCGIVIVYHMVDITMEK
jgi:hypothetical protein